MNKLIKTIALILGVGSAITNVQALTQIPFFQAIASGQIGLPFVKPQKSSFDVDNILEKVAKADPNNVIINARKSLDNRKIRSAAANIVSVVKEFDADNVAENVADVLKKVQRADKKKILEAVEAILLKAKKVNANAVECKIADVIKKVQNVRNPNVVVRRLIDLVRSPESVKLVTTIISLVNKHGAKNIKGFAKDVYNNMERRGFADASQSAFLKYFGGVYGGLTDGVAIRRATEALAKMISVDALLRP
ncbi:hypothetical protein KAU11_01755 [Candidatus Babeliales bacterium]|nr:hypothetical protein [Candidatus Babeliales bacterium]